MTVVHHFIGYKSRTKEKNILVYEKHKRKAQDITQEAVNSGHIHIHTIINS